MKSDEILSSRNKTAQRYRPSNVGHCKNRVIYCTIKIINIKIYST